MAGGMLVTTANAQAPVPAKENLGLIGKITANWCPPCGSWGWQLNGDMLSAAGSNATGLSIYSSTRTDNDNDKFQNQAAYDLAQKITLSGYPSFSWNMNDVSSQNSSGGGVNTAGIKSDVADSVTALAAAPVIASTGMTYTIQGDMVTVETKTKFWEDANGTYNVAVYLVEDGALAGQASQSGIVGHKYVLRSSMTPSTWGEQIATGAITANDEFDKTFTFDLSSSITPAYADQPSTWDKTKLKPFAVIYKSSGPGSYDYVNGAKKYSFAASVGNVSGNVSNVSIFPNPAAADATVSFDTHVNTTASIQVIDAMGRSVYNSGSIEVAQGRYLHTINTSGLAAGIYNVTVQTENGSKTIRLSVTK